MFGMKATAATRHERKAKADDEQIDQNRKRQPVPEIADDIRAGESGQHMQAGDLCIAQPGGGQIGIDAVDQLTHVVRPDHGRNEGGHLAPGCCRR